MSHLGTTRNPMSEARRQHVHGSLGTSDLPRREGRWLLLMLMAFAVVGAIGAAALP